MKMIFNKNGKKGKGWKWRKIYLEEVQTCKYLSFTFNRKGNYKEHIKELRKKDRITANKIRSLRTKRENL